MSSVDIKFDNKVNALILLSSLPESWNATMEQFVWKEKVEASSNLRFDSL